MPQIIVASTNPVKIKATQLGFTQMFPQVKFKIEGVATESGVAAQPLSLQETIQGALNRAEHANRQIPYADYWIGIEGGIQETSNQDKMMTFAWIVIKSKTGQIGQGSTGAFALPPPMKELINQGIELGEADDLIFGRRNSKQNEGAVGLLTGNVLTRTTFYIPGVILALIPFKNQKLWQNHN